MREAVEAVAARIRSARAEGSSLRITGAGTWLDAGSPCTATAPLSLAPTSGITEYEPGDLTITAGAATPLAELTRATAAEGQWLALDPPGSRSMTLGAVIATGAWGPLAHSFGTPRDHVLGCEFVTGAGDIIRAGGRVVKNVAGFDLVRLVTGAWGTLGAITEVTVRLRALPELDRTFAVHLSGRAASVDQAWRWLRHSEYVPLAAELVSPSLASALGIGTSSLMLVRFGGNAAFVGAAELALRALGDLSSVDSAVWEKMQGADHVSAASLRLSVLPSRVAALWSRAREIAEHGGGHAHATLSRGVVRCVVPHASTNSLRELAETAREEGTTGVGERLPAELWPVIRRPSAADALSVRVKAAFDPAGVLNPGILGILGDAA